MKNKILITGATGGLGSRVVTLLKEKTAVENITVLVRNDKNELAQQYRNDGIEVRVGDYANIESLENAFKVINILYFVSGGDDDQRLKLHKNVIDAAKTADVKHILYTSGARKDERDPSPLAALFDSHKQTENFIKASGITYTLLRHNLYAEVIKMMIGDRSQLLRTKTIYLPTANGLTSFVPKDDLAEAEVNIIMNPSAYANKVLEFNGSEQITFLEISKEISKIVNEPIGYISPEVDEFESRMNQIGLPDHVVEILVTFGLAIAKGEFNQQLNDLEMVLGRKTKSLSQFLKEAYS